MLSIVRCVSESDAFAGDFQVLWKKIGKQLMFVSICEIVAQID